MVNIDNHFQILTIQEVINIKKNFLNLKGKNELIIFVPLWACIDTCDVVLGFECFSLYTRRLNSTKGSQLLDVDGLAARQWAVQLHNGMWRKQARGFLDVFQPTSMAFPADLNGFGILLRF